MFEDIYSCTRHTCGRSSSIGVPNVFILDLLFVIMIFSVIGDVLRHVVAMCFVVRMMKRFSNDGSVAMFNLYLFYNDYETSYTTYINHASWHRCLGSDGLRVGGNRSARRKPTCLTR